MKARGTGLLLVLLCATFLLFAPIPAAGQAVYGSVFGTFTDPQGAAIPGVKVTVTAIGKGTTETTTTNESGNYTVTHLIPGSYQVRGEKEGFKAFLAELVDVRADVASRVDGQLQVGAVAETVTVTAESVPLLKTDRADVATSFNQKAVEELPIFNRNFTQFLLVSPGTQRLMWQHASSENPQGSIQIMVNGQHFSGTSFQLDGTDNRDPILGIIVINPTLESVTESKITSQNYDAEFGQAIAGVVTAQTKSGSNDLHGSLFWFRRNDVTSARNPFTQSIPNSITGKFLPDTIWNQFGASLGGPIKKNKSFVFGDYQGTRSKLGETRRKTSPTAAIRGGDLSAFLQPPAPGAPLVQTTEGAMVPFQTNMVFDPTTGNPDGTGRQVFSTGGRINVIPAARLSARALSLLSLIALPNFGTAVNDNFIASGAEAFNSNQFNVRVDHYLTEKWHLLGRYSFAQFDKSAPGVYGGNVGGEGLSPDGFAGLSKTRNQSIAAGFDYSLGTTWFTDFRFGFYRYRVNVQPNGIGTTPATDAGIPGLNLGDDFTSGMPEFNIDGTGGFRFGFALGTNRCNCPLQQEEQQFQFVNNWTNIRGNHSLKWGADIRYAQNLRVPSDKHRAGQLNFNNDRTGRAGVGGGLGIATFLLGDVTTFERYVSTTLDAAERQHRWFFYGQDTWRVAPKLTVNLGLRWEIYRPQSVTGSGRGGFVDLRTGEIRVAGVGPNALNFNVENTFTNFAPRLGIAYQVTPKTIVRMGYGRSYDIGVFGSIFGHSVTQNLPVLATQQVPTANSFQAAFTLAAGPPAFNIATQCQVNTTTGRCPLPNGIAQFVQPEKMRLGALDAWNVTIQHQLTPTISVEGAYVGNKGTHMFTDNAPDYNPNIPIIAGFVSGRNANLFKPFFNGPINGFGAPFGWSQDLRYHANDASNNYHALQGKVEKRFSSGYQFFAHYTWSKNINYDSDYYAWDPRVNRGVTDFNRTHVFSFSNVWELPFGKGKRYLGDVSTALDYLVGGWAINSITSWESGLPFSPGMANCGALRDTGPCRPDRIGDPELADPNQNGWFKVGLGSGTPWGSPAVGTFGNEGRNRLRGPGFFNTDLSFFKNFRITERLKGQFRAESFNIWNHVNLENPRNCVNCNPAEDGKIFNIGPGATMRQWQFAMKFDF